jgi:ubiquinone biosynthesis monooxygenase Coq7
VVRRNPAEGLPENLSSAEKKQSGRLMRINHTGEICAQALYIGQSFTATRHELRETFSAAAQEESDHLHWCQERLQELDSHHSYLDPLWYTGSLAIGVFAGLCGDKWSLGFLAETEKQVFDHLTQHLDKLPAHDEKSRQILQQMRIDEAKHADTAVALGAHTLPLPIKFGMQCMAKVMTTVTYYV